jgi:hypothetical protein
MLKIVFLAILFNTSTGEVVGGVTAKFPDMESCEKVLNSKPGEVLPPVPYGHQLYMRCINPSDVAT